MKVKVELELDQWPVVLKAMEIAAEVKKKEFRDTAEACILETRHEIFKQVWSLLEVQARAETNCPCCGKLYSEAGGITGADPDHPMCVDCYNAPGGYEF